MTNYPKRYDPASDYHSVLYPDDGRHMHSYDLNDQQGMFDHRIKTVADVFLKDGNVVRGGSVNVDTEKAVVIIEPSAVYMDGAVYELERAELDIDLDALVTVGVCLVEEVVNYEHDPALRGAVTGTRAFGEPGADRLRKTAQWGVDVGNVDGAGCAGKFFAVYLVDHGVIIDKKPPPQFDPVNSALARYDREANGHYVVSGWQVIAFGLEGDFQAFSILEGTINVFGRKITRDSALRLKQREEPDIYEVEAEPHHIPDDAGDRVEINLSHGPIASVLSVTILKQRTVSLTHGAYSGVSDPLPDSSISEIVSIHQGETSYVKDDDYTISGSGVDWSPTRGAEGGTPDRETKNGAEPAPGSTYEVTYRYMDALDPDEIGETSITVSGAVPGSTAIVKYTYALPRIDVLAVNRDGLVQYIKGQSTRYDPWPPSVPDNMIKLAEITNRWGGIPEVRNVATHSVHYNQIENHGELIDDIIDLVAQERLKRDMDAREPTAKRGVFVDPFLDDDMRDQGLEQSAAIVDETLQLPVTPSVNSIESGSNTYQLPYVEETLVEQPLSTGCMKINPYMAFEPLPARMRISPAVDFWTVVRTRWASALSRRFVRGRGNRSRTIRTQSIVSAGTQRTEVETLRRREVSFWIEGFGPGENVDRVTFDGVDVTPRS